MHRRGDSVRPGTGSCHPDTDNRRAADRSPTPLRRGRDRTRSARASGRPSARRPARSSRRSAPSCSARAGPACRTLACTGSPCRCRSSAGIRRRRPSAPDRGRPANAGRCSSRRRRTRRPTGRSNRRHSRRARVPPMRIRGKPDAADRGSGLHGAKSRRTTRRTTLHLPAPCRDVRAGGSCTGPQRRRLRRAPRR